MTHGTDDDTKIGLWTVWSIGAGAAVGGDFFGWQLVVTGGYLDALLALIVTAVFYWIYAGAITDLSARYKTSGGAFDFCFRALGPKYGAWMAILGMLKLILANAANALAICSYLSSSGVPTATLPLIWIAFYIFFTGLDCIGVRQSAGVQIGATIFCLGLIVFYIFSSTTKFNIQNLLVQREGASLFFQGLAFALPTFDGFEDIPLLITYVENPDKTIPRALFLSYCTVFVLAFSLVTFGTAVTGIDELLESEAPLMPAFGEIYGSGTVFYQIIANCIVVGLIVNFFAFILFGSQQLQAVAEAGQLPPFLKYRHPKHGSPIKSSVILCFVGIIITSVFYLIFGLAEAQNVILTASLLPAVLGYALVLEAVVECIKYESAIASPKAIAKMQNVDSDELTPKLKDTLMLMPDGDVINYDAGKLGDDPLELRFKFGIYGARFAQFICILFVIALFILGSIEFSFLCGLITVTVMALLAYLIMYFYIQSTQARVDEKINEFETMLEENKSKREGLEGLGDTIRESFRNLRDSFATFIRPSLTPMKSKNNNDNNTIRESLIGMNDLSDHGLPTPSIKKSAIQSVS